MTIEQLNVTVLLGAAVLMVAVIAVRFTVRSGMPSLLLYLAIGMLLGEAGLGIAFSDYGLTTVLGYSALGIILGEGGFNTHWSSIKSAVRPAAALATVGTTVSIVVTGAAVHYLFHLDWLSALLLGAVVSSTDAAAVFSVLRNVGLPRRLSGLLEAESGFNDAPVVILVVALAEAATGHGDLNPLVIAGHALFELAGGTVVGLAVGVGGAALLRALAFPSVGLYPIATMGLTAMGYGLAASMHVSGFISVYLCGLVLGNSDLPHRKAVQSFTEGMGWLAQIGLFIMLGLVVSPAHLPQYVVPALVVGLVLLLVARPLSVIASVSWFGYSWRDQVFLSWAGLRGAVPIVLATIPIELHATNTNGFFETVFLLVVIFTLIQAPTLPPVARFLRLAGDEPRDLDLDTSPLGAFDAIAIQVQVGAGSRLGGLQLFELRLPPQAKIALIVRDGQSLVPSPSTRLRPGDALLIITTEGARDETERRLRSVSEGGRLATWRAGGQPAPPRPRHRWEELLRRRPATGGDTGDEDGDGRSPSRR